MKNSNEAWIDALKAACERSSQSKVAADLGYSPAVINQVLKGNYKGNIDRVREVVEGALMGRIVMCPVVGELPRNKCLEYQRREFAATNPARVQMYHACRNRCPNSQLTTQNNNESER